MSRTFEDLPVWQRGRELVRDVYAATRRQPFSRDAGLCDQIQRAAVSICSNIAEGHERDPQPTCSSSSSTPRAAPARCGHSSITPRMSPPWQRLKPNHCAPEHATSAGSCRPGSKACRNLDLLKAPSSTASRIDAWKDSGRKSGWNGCQTDGCVRKPRPRPRHDGKNGKRNTEKTEHGRRKSPTDS